MKTCDTCNAEKTSIPYVVHEATATRLERINTRLWIVVLILIFALITSNLAWIIYEKQFEVIESDTIIDCEQSGEPKEKLSAYYHGFDVCDPGTARSALCRYGV